MSFLYTTITIYYISMDSLKLAIMSASMPPRHRYTGQDNISQLLTKQLRAS